MPKPTSVTKEAVCEVGKKEMIKAFNVGVKKIESKVLGARYKKNKMVNKSVKANEDRNTCNSKRNRSCGLCKDWISEKSRNVCIVSKHFSVMWEEVLH